MNFFFDLSSDLSDLIQKSQIKLSEFFFELKDQGQEENLPSPHISELHRRPFEILEGSIRISYRDRLFFILEKGDYWMFPLSVGMSFHSDFAVRVRTWDSEEFESELKRNPSLVQSWMDAYTGMFEVFLLMSAEFLPGSLSVDTETEIFEAGQTIIEQGTKGREVYTLLDGSAKVVCDGVEVGRIQNNEIFGAIAALSEVPRTASVVAEEACTVMKIDENQFLKLVQSRPETILRLCKDLAMKLSELNQKMVGLN